MIIFEGIFLYVLLGAIFPILFFLAGWWGGYFIAPENLIPYFTLAGLAIGILLDVLLLQRLVKSAYQIPFVTMVFIYLFYSIGIYGFLMGMPLFNIIMGPLAGFYAGRRLRHAQTDLAAARLLIQHTSFFTAFVLAVACAVSLFLAVGETTLAANINGMLKDIFGLKIAFDNQTIIALSVIAGFALVVAEYLLTSVVATLVFAQQE